MADFHHQKKKKMDDTNAKSWTDPGGKHGVKHAVTNAVELATRLAEAERQVASLKSQLDAQRAVPSSAGSTEASTARTPSQCSLLSADSSTMLSSQKYPTIRTLPVHASDGSEHKANPSQAKADEFAMCPVFTPLSGVGHDGHLRHSSSQSSLSPGSSSLVNTGSHVQRGDAVRKPLTRVGYLKKQGSRMPGSLSRLSHWKRRYFVLQDRALYYFKSKEDAEMSHADPLGVIPLDGFFGVAQQEHQYEKKGFVQGVRKKSKSMIHAVFPWLQSPQDQHTVHQLKRQSTAFLKSNEQLPVSAASKDLWSFSIEAAGRQWNLAAETEQDMLDWLAALQDLLRYNVSLFDLKLTYVFVFVTS